MQFSYLRHPALSNNLFPGRTCLPEQVLGSWKAKSFGLCGVQVEQRPSYDVELDQHKYTQSSIHPLDINTHRGLDRPLTPHEITNLRGVWGALRWKVPQTSPQRASPLSQLQGRMSTADAKLAKDTNGLVQTVKSEDYTQFSGC